MTTLRFDNLQQYSDVLRSRRGEAITVRFVEPRDGEELQNYFRSLSTRSRYNRFLGAMSELPKPVLDRFTHVSTAAGFTVVATKMIDGFETIVGEARYLFHSESKSFEFGISIDDARLAPPCLVGSGVEYQSQARQGSDERQSQRRGPQSVRPAAAPFVPALAGAVGHSGQRPVVQVAATSVPPTCAV